MTMNHLKIIRDSNLFYNDEQIVDIIECKYFYNIEYGSENSYFYEFFFDFLKDEYVYTKIKVKIFDLMLRYWSLIVATRIVFNFLYIFVKSYFYKLSIIKKFTKLDKNQKFQLYILENTSTCFNKYFINDCLESNSLIKAFNFENYF